MRIRPRGPPWRASFPDTLRLFNSSIFPASQIQSSTRTPFPYRHEVGRSPRLAFTAAAQICLYSTITASTRHVGVCTTAGLYRSVSTVSMPRNKLRSKNYDYAKDYMRQLDLYLPPALRQARNDNTKESADVSGILTVLGKAQSDRRGSLNLLSRMALQGRSRAAVHILDKILNNVSTARPASLPQLPSTVVWPQELTSDGMTQPVVLPLLQQFQSSRDQTLQARYEALPTFQAQGLGSVWRFIGSLVIESTYLNPENASAAMSIVYQTLAKLHHLGLVPDNIYNHARLPHSSTMQRPPILHLLSSRILTTLSDATWRSYQEEAILRDAELGVDHRQTQDPPGGRFRVKVRGLGPELWLEFILWCCVESNCFQAGASLIYLLGKQVDNPWFAVNWAGSGNSENTVHVDWERVNSRTGGTVGRIEGYSSERPLVEAPPRTVSVDVVLALIESSVDSMSAADISTSKQATLAIRTIRNLVGFLEPHNLSEEYFDYLTARLLVATSGSVFERPLAFESLANTVTELRSLQPAQGTTLAPVGMNFRSIVQHSELYAGLLHTTMHALACNGHVWKTVEAFDKIQSTVDSSKMQAIAAFINTPAEARGGFFNAAPAAGDKDFTMSHGQIPYARLASFLDLLTENNVTNLAEWLIYSTDADGPLLPGTSFQRTSVAAALARFGGASNDPQLLRYVLAAMRFRHGKPPPVSLLRWMANAQMQCLNFQAAEACLKALTPILAGGYHPDNVACIAACVLHLEAKIVLDQDPATAQDLLDAATSLMTQMLNGRFDGSPGEFYIAQLRLFNQQIGHLLRICESIQSPALNEIASRYRMKFPPSNARNLSPRSFNILLHGVVDGTGPSEGIRIWQMFCEHPADGVDAVADGWADMRAFGRADYYGELDFTGDIDRAVERSDDSEQDVKPQDVADQATPREQTALAESSAAQEHQIGPTTSEAEGLTFYGGDAGLANANFDLPFEDFIATAKSSHGEITGSAQPNSVPDKPTPSEEGGNRQSVVIPNVQSFRIIINRIMDDAASTQPKYKRDDAIMLLRSTWAYEQFHTFGLEAEHQEAFRGIRAAVAAEKGKEERISAMSNDRISFGPLELDFVAMPGNKGSEVNIRELFAREERNGWVTRMPRVRYHPGQRKRMADREAVQAARELGSLYGAMARKSGEWAKVRGESEKVNDGQDVHGDDRMFEDEDEGEYEDEFKHYSEGEELEEEGQEPLQQQSERKWWQ